MRGSRCCENVGLNRGRWTAEEDEALVKYIKSNGKGSWKSLPKHAGLLRCGKSCRLRWVNYLREDLKRGNITNEEDELIVKLHETFGNRFVKRWSMIASHLPGRTDNEIKNYWNSHLSRQIYRFFKNTTKAKTSTSTATGIATLVNQKKQRVRRVSRHFAKKYNHSTRCSKNNKLPSSSTTKESSPQTMMDKEVHENVADCSKVVTNMNGSQVHDDVISEQLESNRIGFQDDELFKIENFLQGEAMDSSGIGEHQIDQWLAEIDVEYVKKNEMHVDEREDESLSLNSLA